MPWRSKPNEAETKQTHTWDVCKLEFEEPDSETCSISAQLGSEDALDEAVFVIDNSPTLLCIP